MGWLLAVLISAAPALSSVPAAPVTSAETCPVTQPSLPMVPPAPYPIDPPGDRFFWHGTPAFWTMLEKDAHWTVGSKERLTTKVFWWRPGFDGALENFPDLTLTIRRLGTGESIVLTRKATNARDESFGGSTMLTGMTIPWAGCWEITGEHRGNTVSFTVWVTE